MNFKFTHPNSIFKVILRNTSFRFRMSAKSTFWVIDIKSMCMHTQKVGEKNLFFYSKVHKNGSTIRIMYISAKFSNWHFKHNILGEELGNLKFGNWGPSNLPFISSFLALET